MIILIKINKNNDIKNLNFLLKDLPDVYAYISTHWINILSIDSKKSNAIEFISKLNNYNEIYVVGNGINDYDMLKKYNGYFINNKKSSDFNSIKNFLELENIIKND